VADPIVLKWEEQGLSTLIRAITDLNRSLTKFEKEAEDADKATKGFEKTTSSLNRQEIGRAHV